MKRDGQSIFSPLDLTSFRDKPCDITHSNSINKHDSPLSPSFVISLSSSVCVCVSCLVDRGDGSGCHDFSHTYISKVADLTIDVFRD